MPLERALTPTEAKVIECIKQSVFDYGFPPTIREICSYMGWASTASAHRCLAKLRDDGFIIQDPNKSRTITVLK